MGVSLVPTPHRVQLYLFIQSVEIAQPSQNQNSPDQIVLEAVCLFGFWRFSCFGGVKAQSAKFGWKVPLVDLFTDMVMPKYPFEDCQTNLLADL